MNKSNQSNDKPSTGADSDIAELFNQQEIELPTALDDRIRAMARAELETTIPVATRPKKRSSRYTPLFATAAVMVLAVALVPMLVKQSPTGEQRSAPRDPVEELSSFTSADTAIIEQASDTMPAAQSDAVAETAEEAEGSTKQDTPSVMNTAKPSSAPSLKAIASEAVTSTGGSAGAIVDEITVSRDVSNRVSNDLAETTSVELSNVKSSVSDKIRALSASSKQSKKSTANLFQADNAYRENQESWMIELKRLFETGEEKTFLIELALFKKQHPSLDLQKHLSPEALALDDDSAVHEK